MEKTHTFRQGGKLHKIENGIDYTWTGSRWFDTVAEQQRLIIVGLRTAITDSVSSAIEAGIDFEDIRRDIIDGVLDAMDYESAGQAVNQIVNQEYR